MVREKRHSSLVIGIYLCIMCVNTYQDTKNVALHEENSTHT